MGPVSDPMPEQADHDERGEWKEGDERVLHILPPILITDGARIPAGDAGWGPPPPAGQSSQSKPAGGNRRLDPLARNSFAAVGSLHPFMRLNSSTFTDGVPRYRE